MPKPYWPPLFDSIMGVRQGNTALSAAINAGLGLLYYRGNGDVQAWAVEEAVPAGWRVTAISADGHWDEKAGVVRWGPFFDEAPQSLLGCGTFLEELLDRGQHAVECHGQRAGLRAWRRLRHPHGQVTVGDLGVRQRLDFDQRAEIGDDDRDRPGWAGGERHEASLRFPTTRQA